MKKERAIMAGKRRIIPNELTEVLQGLTADWKLSSFRRWGMGWIANLQMKDRRFLLVSDRFYIDASEIVDGKQKQIPPLEDQRISISSRQICAILLNAAK